MQKLNAGDRVAILSPASIIHKEYVEGACETLRQWGFVPRVMPHTLGACGSMAGTVEERLADFTDALRDPEVKAIICSRGGYGAVHLLPQLDKVLAEPQVLGHPKWLVGFSDISALHALWGKHKLESVHASMTKHLANGPGMPENRRLLALLTGETDEVVLPSGYSGSPYARNIPGVATGRVVGGNMAVIGGLLGTPYSQIAPGTILLIEDIAEPIYKVERLLWQLRLSGILDRLAGLLVGQFTDYRKPSADYADMYQMIIRMTEGAPYPVAMDLPAGHIDDDNRPVLLGRDATLTVTDEGARLEYV